MVKAHQHLEGAEVGPLVLRIQELLEVNVLALVVQTATGHIGVVCPSADYDKVAPILKLVDWDSLADHHEQDHV